MKRSALAAINIRRTVGHFHRVLGEMLGDLDGVTVTEADRVMRICDDYVQTLAPDFFLLVGTDRRKATMEYLVLCKYGNFTVKFGEIASV